MACRKRWIASCKSSIRWVCTYCELRHPPRLLTIEAQGDYAAAKKLQDEMGVVRPALQKSLDSLQAIPTDIDPIFVTADELVPVGGAK